MRANEVDTFLCPHKALQYQRKRPQADQRAGLEERLLLGVQPPFATGADRSLETQLSFLRNFLLVDRLGLLAGQSSFIRASRSVAALKPSR